MVAQVRRHSRAVVTGTLEPLVRDRLLGLLSVRVFVLSSRDADMFQDVSAHQVLKNRHYQIFESSLRPHWKL